MALFEWKLQAAYESTKPKTETAPGSSEKELQVLIRKLLPTFSQYGKDHWCCTDEQSSPQVTFNSITFKMKENDVHWKD